MTRRLLNIVAAITLVTGLACAQGPGHAQNSEAQALSPAARLARRLVMLTKVLDLTEVQVASAKEIFADALAQDKTARAPLEGLHEQLKTAVRSNGTAAIDTIAASIGTVHGQVVAINAKARAKFILLLTPEQLAKLEALDDHLPLP
jgi:Spy/CpxP family protein refolding chaperone